MTRKELGLKLNAVFEVLDSIDQSVGSLRVKSRLNIIRDQVILIALDLNLPVQPVKEEKSDGEGERPEGSTG